MQANAMAVKTRWPFCKKSFRCRYKEKELNLKIRPLNKPISCALINTLQRYNKKRIMASKMT